MEVTQISNIFNTIVQADPTIGSYQFGFPNEVNTNRPNNFDPNSETGNIFPLVVLIPPNIDGRVEPSGEQSIYETYRVDLVIADTYGYEQQQLGFKTDTTVLILARLNKIWKRMLKALQDYQAVSQPPFMMGDYTVELDSIRFIQQTRTIRVRLDLFFNSICEDYEFDPIAAGLPIDPKDIATYDFEDPLNTDPV